MKQPNLALIQRINQLSQRRLQLYIAAGHTGGMSFTQRQELDDLNRQLALLWQEHTDCANPFCPCRIDHNGHNEPHHVPRGRIRLWTQH